MFVNMDTLEITVSRFDILRDFLAKHHADEIPWDAIDRIQEQICATIPKDHPTGTEAEVCADIARRQQLGIAKYGTTVAANPLELRAWLQHAYEECIDQAIYLKRAITELDK